MRSPRLGALGLRPTDLLAAARVARPRPRLDTPLSDDPAAAHSSSSLTLAGS
jgi:hypothetical protein